MSAHKVTPKQFKQIGNLLRRSHRELSALRMTESLLKEHFPVSTEREALCNWAVFDPDATAAALLDRLGVGVKRRAR